MASDNANDQDEPYSEYQRDDGDEGETPPLERVRFGLGKELCLYDDALVVNLREQHEETRYNLDNIRRLALVPGEHTPSKLVLMFELDDGNVVIAAEGMTNVRGFRKLLAKLREIRPEIELDPPNMDEELRQALVIRGRYSLGCYGLVFGSCILLLIVYFAVAALGHFAR